MTQFAPHKPHSETQSAGRLADKIQAVLTKARAQARAAVGKIGTRAYWQVGKFIQQDILRNKGRASYGDGLLADLSVRLKISQSLLYQSLEYYRQNPIFQSPGKLTWTHQVALLQVENTEQKRRLEKTAAQSNWPVSRLEKEIKKLKVSPSSRPLAPSSRPLPPFKPRHGKLHTWLVRLAIKNAEQPELDLGFYTFRGLTSEELKRFPEGSVVTLENGRLVKSEAAKNELYTYEAELERVVDGDTVWVKINLGFGISARKKLRLRGIDCPELNTAAGKRAKKFAEDFFISPQFTVTTTKPDKYDRYLSDIWRGEENLNLLLLKNGHARVKTSYAESDWPDPKL